jgi:hypothetical protein
MAWGLVGIHYFRLAAAARTTRLSHYRFNVIRTQKKQTIAQLDYDLYSPGGAYQFAGMAKFSYYPDQFYGLGNRTLETEREDFTSSNWRLQAELLRRFGRKLFAGVRLEINSLDLRETQKGGLLESRAVPGGGGGALAGLGLHADWDSRDNTFSTARGALASLVLSRYGRLLGGDFAFGQLTVDARLYRPTGWGAVLAAQVVFKTVWGDCPFFALPRFGGLNLLRGYFDGRYRDRCLLAAQAEWRQPVWKRVGMCLFAGAAQVQGRPALLELDGFHLAGGVGLRYKFNPRENLVIRLDAGFAAEKPAFYLTFAEAF